MSENTLLSASSVSGLVLGPESWEECGSVSGHDGGRGGVWMSNKAASIESNSSAVLLLPSSQPKAPPPPSSLLCCLPSHPPNKPSISSSENKYSVVEPTGEACSMDDWLEMG